jgi:hypothetical protein
MRQCNRLNSTLGRRPGRSKEVYLGTPLSLPGPFADIDAAHDPESVTAAAFIENSGGLLGVDHAPALRRDGSIDGLAGRRRFEQRAVFASLIALRRFLILHGFLRHLRVCRRCRAEDGRARGCSRHANHNGQHTATRNIVCFCHCSLSFLCMNERIKHGGFHATCL